MIGHAGDYLGEPFSSARLDIQNCDCRIHPYTETLETFPRRSGLGGPATEPREVPTFDGFRIALIEQSVEK
jgi:hypothetical protein